MKSFNRFLDHRFLNSDGFFDKGFCLKGMKYCAVFILLILLPNVVQSAEILKNDPQEKPAKKRPYYEYPGNYRDQINERKNLFKEKFGYDLMDLDQAWRPQEIDRFHQAFLQLPESFYRLSGIKGFYRISRLRAPEKIEGGDVPAATFPKFMTVYRSDAKSYHVDIDSETPRIEFFNSLFYESVDDFFNIVHHEMGHLYDILHGFQSFQDEWLKLTQFRVVHMPALDGKPDSDFLFSLINNPQVLNYAPVSTRHLPTYSRENPQEDYANSVAAYMHYPYFRFSHPKRYQYLKKHVFAGKEYFSFDGKISSFSDAVLNDFSQALSNLEGDRILKVAREVSRSYHPDTEKATLEMMRNHLTRNSKTTQEMRTNLAIASCYFSDPGALVFRQTLLKDKLIKAEKVLRDDMCRRISRKSFEENQSHWPPSNLVFYRVGKKDFLQFLDPAEPIARARGFETRYHWELFSAGARKKSLAKGQVKTPDTSHASMTIPLNETAIGNYRLLEDNLTILELKAERWHPIEEKRFLSEINRIQFVAQPWFSYFPQGLPEMNIRYPLKWGNRAELEKGSALSH